MNDDVAEELRRLDAVVDHVRRRLIEAVAEVEEINQTLGRLAELRPEIAAMLLSDATLQCRSLTAAGPKTGPYLTLALQRAGGLGVVVSRTPLADRHAGNGHSQDLTVTPFATVPPLIQRLLVPHVEHVVESLIQRIEP